MNNYVLQLNVGGRYFSVESGVLKKHQFSRLTRLFECRESLRCVEFLCDDFNASTQVYYFDRDPDAFFWILRCYHTSVVHLPKSVCPMGFCEEKKYWGIEDAVLDGSYIERFDKVKMFMEEFEAKARICREARLFNWEKNSMKFKPIRGIDDIRYNTEKIRWTMWVMFNEPSSSIIGKLWAILSVSVILLSLVTFAVETLPKFQSKDERGFEIENKIFAVIEEVCIIWFTLEYLLQLVASPEKLVFIRQLMNIIDLVTIIPYYAQLIASRSGEDSHKSVSHLLQLFRIMRVMRVLRLGRHSSGLQVLCKTMIKSSKELALLGLYLFIGIIILATTVQVLEPDKFTNIGEALWWATITVTTVGYGDSYPETIAGKLVAALAFFTGVLVIGLPTHPVIANFTHYYKRAADIEDAFARSLRKEVSNKSRIRGQQINFF